MFVTTIMLNVKTFSSCLPRNEIGHSIAKTYFVVLALNAEDINAIHMIMVNKV